MATQPKKKTLADLVNEVGPALYGEEWMDRLTEALGVKRETLRNIRRGNMTVGAEHGLVDDLRAVAERRAKETAAARDAIRAWVKKNRTSA
jgi:hypothetical protein